ncbi:MAG: helix-turn-helix transcriptional regulator [Eubacterium sp.]|nr:helix-turn-helix transcriptional regulator [Eubacterium sp.]
MISYAPLWETMKRKNISTYTLIYKMGFDAHTLSDMKHNKSVTAHTLEILCGLLDCTPNDVIEFLPDSEPEA